MSGLVVNRTGFEHDPQVGAVFALEFEVMLLSNSLAAAFDIGLGNRLPFFIHKGEERLAHYFIQTVAEHIGHSLVDKSRVVV